MLSASILWTVWIVHTRILDLFDRYCTMLVKNGDICVTRPAQSTFCQKFRKPSYFTTPPLHCTALHGGLGPLPPVRQARTHDITRTMTQECNLIWCYQVSAQQRGERFQETIHMGGREILTKSLLFLFLAIDYHYFHSRI